MKKKVGNFIEEDVIRRAKRRAVEEGRPLSNVIQDALFSYLNVNVSDRQKRERAYHSFCEQPMRISKRQFKGILREDV